MARLLASAAVAALLLVAQLGAALSASTVAQGTSARTSGEYCSVLGKANCDLPIGCEWIPADSRCTRRRSAPATAKATTTESGDVSSTMPPVVPLPWTTTQQRTHTFDTLEFLSIAEEQSQRLTEDGMTQAAFYIYPATPFSMRDPGNTIVQGMRGVFTTDAAKGAGWIHKVIWLTNLTGHNYCYANVVANSTVDGTIPAAPSKEVIRGNGDWGVPVTRFTTYYNTTGTTTMDYVTEARGGAYANGSGIDVQYPLRKIRDYQGSTPGEKGYMLDLGQHFPVAIDSWFDMSDLSGCPPATVQVDPIQRGPDGGFDLDHHKLLKRTALRR